MEMLRSLRGDKHEFCLTVINVSYMWLIKFRVRGKRSVSKSFEGIYYSFLLLVVTM